MLVRGCLYEPIERRTPVSELTWNGAVMGHCSTEAWARKREGRFLNTSRFSADTWLMKVLSMRQGHGIRVKWGNQSHVNYIWRLEGRKEEEMAYLHVSKTKTVSYLNQAPVSTYSSKADGPLAFHHLGSLP